MLRNKTTKSHDGTQQESQCNNYYSYDVKLINKNTSLKVSDLRYEEKYTSTQPGATKYRNIAIKHAERLT